MDKHVLPAVIPSDEAEALLGVEPFYRAGLFARDIRRRPIRCRRPEIRSPGCSRNSGAAIDADDLGDVWSLVSRTDPDFEGFAGLHSVDAALSQQAPVEEGIARLIREFDEPEAFVGVEPLDDTSDGRAGRWLEPGLAEPGSGAESTGLRMLGIGVEVTTPRMTKILISQTLVPGGFVPDQSDRATRGRVVADLMVSI